MPDEQKIIKEKIRPIYSELQGRLSQAPKLENTYDIREDTIWKQYNLIIVELSKVSSENYDNYRIIPKDWGDGTLSIGVLDYRTTLGGLIARLHGEFFSDEPAPFSGMPSTIIQQTQNQTQLFQVQMLLEIQSEIDKRIPKFEENSKEKTFLEKIKSSLVSINSVTQLIKLLLETGKNLGIDINQILKIFS